MKVTHTRQRNVIRRLPQPAMTDKDGKETSPPIAEAVETFRSVNRAKLASRELQKRPGVVLRVAP